MKQIMTAFGISSAGTALVIGLILVDAFQIAQQEVATGNTDAIGQFIIVGMLAIISLLILSFAMPGR